MITSLSQYKKRIKRQNIIISLIQIGIFIAILLLWEILTRFNIINGFLLSSPSRIWDLFISMCLNNSLSPHVLISTKEMLVALFLSSFVGIFIASILYLFPSFYRIFEPYLIVLNAIPKTALGPILIIYLGTSQKGIIGVSITFSIIITIISSLSTFNEVDKDLIKMMKVYKASRFKTLLKVVCPFSINGLLSVIKVNIGLSWVGVIVGEYLVSRNGIGYLIMYGSQIFKLDLVMLGIIILSIITLILNLIFGLISKGIRKIVKI